jgi:hypothetical protein
LNQLWFSVCQEKRVAIVINQCNYTIEKSEIQHKIELESQNDKVEGDIFSMQ